MDGSGGKVSWSPATDKGCALPALCVIRAYGSAGELICHHGLKVVVAFNL